MNSKTSGVKKTSVALAVLLIVGLVTVAASLIYITTDSGAAARAHSLLGDSGKAADTSQEAASGRLPPFNDAIQKHVEESQERLQERTRQYPRSASEAEEFAEFSLQEIEAHIDWSQGMLEEHVRKSQERFESIIGKD